MPVERDSNSHGGFHNTHGLYRRHPGSFGILYLFRRDDFRNHRLRLYLFLVGDVPIRWKTNAYRSHHYSFGV